MMAPPQTMTSRRARIRATPLLLRHLDADRARPFEDDAGDEATRLDREIGTRLRRPKVGHRGAPAPALMHRHVHRPQALLPVTVHVVGDRVACLPAGFDERAVERVLHRPGGDVQRAVAAAVIVGALLPRLGALEVGEAVCVGPLFEAADAGPAVVVQRVAADVDHAVDRRRAAEHAPARAGDAPVVHVRLGLGLVGPVVGVVGERVGEGGRHVDEQAQIRRTGLDQQHRDIRLLGEAHREHAARRAGADDDVVVFFRAWHRGSGRREMRAQYGQATSPIST